MLECTHCHSITDEKKQTCPTCGGQHFRPCRPEPDPLTHVDASRAVVWDHPDEWEEVEIEKVAEWKDLH